MQFMDSLASLLILLALNGTKITGKELVLTDILN